MMKTAIALGVLVALAGFVSWRATRQRSVTYYTTSSPADKSVQRVERQLRFVRGVNMDLLPKGPMTIEEFNAALQKIDNPPATPVRNRP